MTDEYLKTGDLLTRLGKRFEAPEWALVAEMAYPDQRRRIDALAVNLYRSRGFMVHGFEIKTHRNDWLKEMRDPDKAEKWWRACDYWWLVVGNKTIVKDDELPAGWGLLVPHGKGLRAVRKPKLAKREEWTIQLHRAFAGKLLRSDVDIIERARSAHYEEGRQAGLRRGRSETGHAALLAKVEKLEKERKAFLDASGLDDWELNRYSAEVGEALKIVLEVLPGKLKARLRYTMESLVNESKRIGKLLADYEEALS